MGQCLEVILPQSFRVKARAWCYTVDGPEWEYCDSTLSTLIASINVIVMIENRNDAPIATFDKSVYFISEDAILGTTIATLEAKDPDYNQILEFEIASTAFPFNISLPGIVSVAQV